MKENRSTTAVHRNFASVARIRCSSLSVLPLICWLATFSTNVQRIHSFYFTPRIRHQPFLSLGYRPNADDVSNEADFISAIHNSRTIVEIHRILQDPTSRLPPGLPTVTPEEPEETDFRTLSPNIAAAALKKLVVLMNNDQSDELAETILPSLLTSVEHSIQIDDALSLYGLSRTLMALARLVRHGRAIHTTLPHDVVARLEAQLPEVTNSYHVPRLPPAQLVGLLDSMRVLQVVSMPVVQGIVTRLSQPGTLGKLSPSDLCRLLWSLQDYYQVPLVGMVLKRLGKQSVHSQLTSREVVLVLRAAVNLCQTECHSDASGMVYNIIKRGLVRSRSTNNDTLVSELTGGQVATVLHAMNKYDVTKCDDVVEQLCHRLSLEESLQRTAGYELAILLSHMRQLDIDEYPQAVAGIGNRFLQLVEQDPAVMEQHAVNSILRNVVHVQESSESVLNSYLQGAINLINDDQFLSQTTEEDLANMMWFLAKAGSSDHSDVAVRIGERLRRRALETRDFSPENLSMVLRYAAVKFGYNQDVMEPFLRAAKYLILAESILARCNEQELRDLVWFASRVKWHDELVISSLAKRALAPDLLDYCSSSAACSLLSSFTTLAQLLDSEKYDMLLSQLFNHLGTQLLSNDLNQRETAEALYSYAKMYYVYDMGIFDHLADLLSRQIDKCSIREIAKSLWACGKMYALEAENSETENVEAPPYFTCARSFAIRLAQRSDELLPQDVAQSIWAVGSLSIMDRNIIGPLAQRAMTIATSCNSQETANILWGLSKVGYSHVGVIRALSARIRSPDLSPTTQEAANTLYALGRLRVDDEATFTALCQVMMDQLNTCTAQAIANALWAFQELGLAPPNQLLERWTLEKLGLNGIANPAILLKTGKGPAFVSDEEDDAVANDQYFDEDDGDDHDLFDGIMLADNSFID